MVGVAGTEAENPGTDAPQAGILPVQREQTGGQSGFGSGVELEIWMGEQCMFDEPTRELEMKLLRHSRM